MRQAQINFYASRSDDKTMNADKTGFAKIRSSKKSNELLKISKSLEKEFDAAFATYTPANSFFGTAHYYPCTGQRALHQNRKHTIIIGAQGSGKTTTAQVIAEKYKKPIWVEVENDDFYLSIKNPDLLIFEGADRIYKEVLTITEYKYKRKGERNVFPEMPRCICILQNEYTPEEIQGFREYAEVIVMQ